MFTSYNDQIRIYLPDHDVCSARIWENKGWRTAVGQLFLQISTVSFSMQKAQIILHELRSEKSEILKVPPFFSLTYKSSSI